MTLLGSGCNEVCSVRHKAPRVQFMSLLGSGCPTGHHKKTIWSQNGAMMTPRRAKMGPSAAKMGQQGAKMEPRPGQEIAKRGQEGQDGAKMVPRCGQEGPRWGQDESKRGQDGAKMEPRWGQKGAVEPPGKILKNVPPGEHRFGPQNGSEGYSKADPILNKYLDQFRGRVWPDFGRHLGRKTGPGGVRRDLREPNRAPRSQHDDLPKSGFRIGLSAFFRF